MTGDTALMMASVCNHEAVVRAFIECKAPLDQRTSKDSLTALMLASQAGLGSICDRLLKGATGCSTVLRFPSHFLNRLNNFNTF